MTIAFTQEQTLKKQCIADALRWHTARHKHTKKELAAFEAGMEQGWADLRSALKLRGLTVDMNH
jgi:hypothetical protein